MDTTWTTAIAIILAQVLPLIGVSVGSDELTTTLKTIVALIGGVVIVFHGWKTGRFTFGGTRLQ